MIDATTPTPREHGGRLGPLVRLRDAVHRESARCRFGGLLADDKDARWQQAMLAWLKNGAKSGFFDDCLNANPTPGGSCTRTGPRCARKASRPTWLCRALPSTRASHAFQPPPLPDPPSPRPAPHAPLAPCLPPRLDVAGHRLPPSPPWALGPRSRRTARVRRGRPRPPPHELVCLSSMRGYNLRGPSTGRRVQSSTTIPPCTRSTGARCSPRPKLRRDLAIKHLPKGDRPRWFNHTLCFAAEVADRTTCVSRSSTSST